MVYSDRVRSLTIDDPCPTIGIDVTNGSTEKIFIWRANPTLTLNGSKDSLVKRTRVYEKVMRPNILIAWSVAESPHHKKQQ